MDSFFIWLDIFISKKGNQNDMFLPALVFDPVGFVGKRCVDRPLYFDPMYCGPFFSTTVVLVFLCPEFKLLVFPTNSA
jgi:hypothetical protein